MFFKQSDILEAAEALEYTLVVLVVLVLVMEGIPNLSKERVCLGDSVIIPSLMRDIALGAPMSAEKYKSRACFELCAAVAAFPFKLSSHITLSHCLGEALAAAELSSLLHILNVKLCFGLCLIITVVKLKLLSRAVILIELDEVEIFPL